MVRERSRCLWNHNSLFRTISVAFGDAFEGLHCLSHAQALVMDSLRASAWRCPSVLAGLAVAWPTGQDHVVHADCPHVGEYFDGSRPSARTSAAATPPGALRSFDPSILSLNSLTPIYTSDGF